MVKTRHSGEVDAETPPRFISLNNEKIRQSTRSGDASETKQLTHVYGSQRHDYSVFDEKVVESRLRPRIGPGRAYNYIDVDSSDEDSVHRQGKHLGFTKSHQVKQEMLDKHQEATKGLVQRRRSFHEDADQSVEDEDDDSDNNKKRRLPTRLRKDNSENMKDGNAANRAKYQSKNHHSDSDDEENVQRSKKSTRQHFEDDDEDAENFIRRSSRTRRQVYDTLNQSYLVSIPGQRKQTTDEQEHSDVKEHEDSDDNEEFSDMYSRVKRKRVRVKRNMYGMPVNEDSDSGEDVQKQNKNNNKDEGDFESETEVDEDEDGTEKEDDINNTSRRVTRQQNVPVKKKQPPIVKSYSLREHKPRTDLYKAPLEERRVKKIHHSIFDTPTKKNTNQAYHSPAQRQNVRKRSAFHSSSSSTSSSDGDSSDEKSFKRRKAKSMTKARSRLMPMNYSTNALPHSSIIKDRIKSGSSLADVEPMNIDKNITFSSIGGLGKHIQALKEMVVFPLLYNNVFQRFNVDPPRGVLFYGPPGTGKTLVARALANECSKGDRRVAFFMRKGADCLSKWVGESERQLRILFDQAYKFRPSIIFFDEIDGLAPVRSSRQDQIHSSIVSTLLALMDGLDSRGEIVVIGATNRIDSLDPALRRPGRFDREFLFPLPSFEARKQILKIHTDSWTPKLNEQFICELAEKCVGYCGADLKSLCTEATMLALRRRYPQIYMTNDALEIDVSSINISARDFFDAVNTIIPTSQRAASAPARALSARVQPLIQRQLNSAINVLKDIFPPILSQASILDAIAMPNQAQLLSENSSTWDDLVSDEDDNGPSIFVPSTSNKGKSLRKSTEENCSRPNYFNFTRSAARCPSTFRPRLMLVGKEGQGQTTYVAPAILHKMENLPVHVLDLTALYAVTAKTPEESCANVFHEAKRKCPSIIYLPHINQWWDIMAETLRATLLTLIHDLNPSLPLLLLATSEQPYDTLDIGLQTLFSSTSSEIIEMNDPNNEERKEFFQELFLDQACKPPPQKKKAETLLKFGDEPKKGNNTLIDQVICEKAHYLEPKNNDLVHKVKTQLAEDVQVKKGRKRKQLDHSLPSCSKKIHFTEQTIKKALLSTHKMILRPRTNIGKLNRNHSAKESKCVNECLIAHSKYPTCWSRPGKLVTSIVPFYNEAQLILQETTQWKSARKSLSVTSRHKRFARRLLIKERNTFTAISELYSSNNFSPNNSKNKCYNFNSCGTCATLHEKVDTKDETNTMHRYNRNYIFTKKNKAIALVSNRKSDINTQVQDIRDTKSAENLMEQQAVSNVHYNLRPIIPKQYAQRMLEVLPKAAPPKPTELTKLELEQLIEKEELTLMELRIFLRDVLNKLGSDKKFSIFAKPVNIENAPDYYEIIEHPMDLSTMMAKIDLHEYGTVRAFMNDIDLICSNALEYNPNRGPMDRIIRHRACALKDTAYAILKTELDKDFEKTCVDIEASRKRRGHKSSTVPNFYCTKPQQQTTNKSQNVTPSYLDNSKPNRSIPKPEGERYSKRVRGLNIDPVLPLEAVEKVFKLSRLSTPSVTEESQIDARESSISIQEQKMNDCNHKDKSNHVALSNDNLTKEEKKCSNSELPKEDKIQSPSSSAAKLKKKSKPNIWCKPKRKRPKLMSKSELSQQADTEMDRLMSKSELSQQADTEMDVNFIQHSSDGNANCEVQSLTSSQQLSQQLRINTSENELSESKEDKSNIPGRATRLKSPHISPRIRTRRNSMSPTNCGLRSTEQSSSGQKPIEEELAKDNTLHQCDQVKQTDDNCHLDLRKHDSVGTETHGKPSAVKRLDLEVVALDSGVGSSVDSNGDSRDSTDHNKTQLTSKQSVILPTSSKETVDLNSEKNANHNCNSALLSAASTLMNESKKEFILDKNRLTSLLNAVVINTEGCMVERLEKIYSQLTQIIFRHRHNYNRNDMIVELEKKVDELTPMKQYGPSTSCKK